MGRPFWLGKPLMPSYGVGNGHPVWGWQEPGGWGVAREGAERQPSNDGRV